MQEEACILGIPCIVTRKSTERKETIDCGATILSGIETVNIYDDFCTQALSSYEWIPPEEYLIPNVSDKIISILKGDYNV